MSIIEVLPPSQPIYDGTHKVTGAYKVGNFNQGKAEMRVSSQWASRPADQRFLDLTTMHAATKAAFENSVEINTTASHLKVLAPRDGNGLVQVLEPTNENPLRLNNWAFGQLCGLGAPTAPAGFLRQLPSPIAGINLQYVLSQRADQIKLYYTSWLGTERNEIELRAATGPKYGRIPDFSVIEQVMKVAGNGNGDTNWKVPGLLDWGSMKYNPFVDVTRDTTTLFASDRDMFVALVDDTHPIEIGKLPDGSPDLVFRGFIVWNSEVGCCTLGIGTFLMRASCCNRIFWGMEGYDEILIRHTSRAPQRFMQEAAPALEEYVNRSDATIKWGIGQAQKAIVARNDEERVDFLAKNFDMGKRAAEAVIATVLNEEGKAPESVWDFVQGLTAMARLEPHQGDRLAIERSAGKLLSKVAKAA